MKKVMLVLIFMVYGQACADITVDIPRRGSAIITSAQVAAEVSASPDTSAVKTNTATTQTITSKLCSTVANGTDPTELARKTYVDSGDVEPIWIDKPSMAARSRAPIGISPSRVFFANPSQLEYYQPAKNLTQVTGTNTRGGRIFWLIDNYLLQLSGLNTTTGSIAYSADNGDTWTAAAGGDSPPTGLTYTTTGTAGSIPHNIIYCTAGKTFYVEYPAASQTTVRIWYSADYGMHWGADAGGTPAFSDGNPIITTATNAITHFHGGVYNGSTLYIFTGEQGAVLTCSDIADLVANPDTWKARWGLDETGSGITPDPAYCLNTNLTGTAGTTHADRKMPADQAYRVLDLLFSGDYIYWITDSSSTDLNCWKQSITTKTRTQIGTNLQPIGSSWNSLTTTSGYKIFACGSEYTTSYRANHDGYNRIYALLSDDRLLEIKKWRRSDFLATVNNTSLVPLIMEEVAGKYIVVEFEGSATGYGESGQRVAIGEVVSKATAANNNGDETLLSGRNNVAFSNVNLIHNSRFLTGNATSDYYDTSGWYGVNSTIAMDSTHRDVSGFYTLKIAPANSQTQCYAKYELPLKTTTYLHDSRVTLSARIWLPATASLATNQVVGIGIYPGGTGGQVVKTWAKGNTELDGTWHEVSVQTMVQPSATSVYIGIYAHYHASATVTSGASIWVTDVRLVQGNNPATEYMMPAKAAVRPNLNYYSYGVTSPVTLTTAVQGVVIFTKADGAQVVNLPAALNNGGCNYTIFKAGATDGTTNKISLTPAGSDKINGTAAAWEELDTQYDTVTVMSDNVDNWMILNKIVQ